MFWPLVLACLGLPFAAFKEFQRYIVLSAVILGLAAFFLSYWWRW
jgi:hypothetical protein